MPGFCLVFYLLQTVRKVLRRVGPPGSTDLGDNEDLIIEGTLQEPEELESETPNYLKYAVLHREVWCPHVVLLHLHLLSVFFFPPAASVLLQTVIVFPACAENQGNKLITPIGFSLKILAQSAICTASIYEAFSKLQPDFLKPLKCTVLVHLFTFSEKVNWPFKDLLAAVSEW